jgi:hypothetical protein
MIISDQKRFVFVHIPKCGGTSVRKALMPYKTPHIGLGGAVGDHRPLFRVKQDYPIIWDKLTRYNSFTIVRQPEPRFFSCVMQRLIDFSGISMPTENDFRRACAADAAFLANHSDSHTWPDEYVHFIPQSEYIFHCDTKVVKFLFALERPDELMSYLSSKIGVSFLDGLSHERRSIGARHSALRKPAQLASKALKPLLESHRFAPAKTILKQIATKNFSAQQVLGPADYKNYEMFAREFYAADFQLWRKVFERSASNETGYNELQRK